MIHLFGDSIFRGAALKRFADSYSPEEIANEPLWPLLWPALTINTLLTDSVVVHGGHTLFPDKVDAARKRMRDMVTIGRIVPTDTIIMLDAGAHSQNPALHQERWLALMETAAAAAARVIVCNTFDNFGREPSEEQRRFSYEARYGARTHNQATEGAASSSSFGTEFVDVASPIRQFQAELVERGLSAYRPDNIHLNMIGSLALFGLLARAIDPGGRLHRKTFRQLARDHFRRLGASTPLQARDAVDLALADRS